MGNAFGKKKKKTKKKGGITAQDRAVLDLKNARDKLRRFQARLDAESELLTTRAAQLLRDGKKDRALLTLKFRRFRQDKANQVDGQLLRLEDMVSAIRWEERQSEVVTALREGNEALKSLHEDMGDVSALMDETRDQLEMEREVSALLSGETTDDSDLLAELDAMAAPALDLPAAPSSLPAAGACGDGSALSVAPAFQGRWRCQRRCYQSLRRHPLLPVSAGAALRLEV